MACNLSECVVLSVADCRPCKKTEVIYKILENVFCGLCLVKLQLYFVELSVKENTCWYIHMVY